MMVFIKLSPVREIYVSNHEIKRLTVLSSTSNNKPNETPKTDSPSQDYFEDDSAEEQLYKNESTYAHREKSRTHGNFKFDIWNFRLFTSALLELDGLQLLYTTKQV